METPNKWVFVVVKRYAVGKAKTRPHAVRWLQFEEELDAQGE